MLSLDLNSRTSIKQFANNSWFNDPFIKSIYILEHLIERSLKQQMIFLKGLNKIVLQYEEKIINKKIIPGLLEAMNNEKLSPPIL